MRNRGIELCILDSPASQPTAAPEAQGQLSQDDVRVVSAAGVPGTVLPEAMVECHQELAASCSVASRLGPDCSQKTL